MIGIHNFIDFNSKNIVFLNHVEKLRLKTNGFLIWILHRKNYKEFVTVCFEVRILSPKKYHGKFWLHNFKNIFIIN